MKTSRGRGKGRGKGDGTGGGLKKPKGKYMKKEKPMKKLDEAMLRRRMAAEEKVLKKTHLKIQFFIFLQVFFM